MKVLNRDREKHNLNALSHETAIGLIRSALNRGVNVQEVYVDTVGSPEKYEDMLRKEFPRIPTIKVAKKADSLYPVVSAASICAKVTRDYILENWKFAESCFQDKPDITATMGSGYPSDPATKSWLHTNLQNVFGFPQLIRFSWSTCDKLLEENAVHVRWPYQDEQEEEAAKASAPFKRQKVSETQTKQKKQPVAKKDAAAPGRGSLFRSMNMATCKDLLAFD